MELTDIDRALLDIESKSWTFLGRKESAIRELTGLSRVQATQRLNKLIDSREALEYAPVVVNRLRRIRAGRLQMRLGSHKG